MEIIVREMRPDEVRIVRRLGRRAFQGFESLWVSTPKTALVAIADGEIAGALLYKIMPGGTGKIGYVDYVFTDPSRHGQGIGGVLYREGAAFLWAQGCSVLSAIVKDDNAASWSLFEKNGFARIGMGQALRLLGPSGFLRQYLLTPACIGVGMDYYAALPGGAPVPDTHGSAVRIAMYLLVCALLVLPVLMRVQDVLSFFAAYAAVLGGTVLAGYIGTQFARRRFSFRMPDCGALMCLLLSLITVFPMTGTWYPVQHENTSACRRDMGIVSLAGWLFLLLLSPLMFAVPGGNAFLGYVGEVSAYLLLYRVLAFYPFESMGGRRVLAWNRAAFAVCALLSAALFVLQMVM